MNPSSSSFPFPPSQPLPTPEDTVFYSIYPDLLSTSPTSVVTSLLHSLHLQINSLIAALIPPTYIWHHDPFSLSPSLSPLPRLHGKTRFGDNLEDEWLITSILFRISESIPSLSIQIHDSDGDFLLIESAFHLPLWLSPDKSQNRIFIRNGKLQIIPKSISPEPPSLASALNIVASEKTEASDPVQSAIKKRIDGYPERAMANMHTARVRVPLPVAQVLKHEPGLISLAVEGFYDRDIDSMKLAARMERFLGDMVVVPVRMSRAMYGQLAQQNFAAPKCYPMPGSADAGYGEAELGMKIACGFEMMYGVRRREGEEGKGETREAFLRSLESSGCFQGVMPGSAEYRRIVDAANEYYRKGSLFSQTRIESIIGAIAVGNVVVLEPSEIAPVTASLSARILHDYVGIECLKVVEGVVPETTAILKQKWDTLITIPYRDMLSAPVRRIDEILSQEYSTEDFKGSELTPPDDDSWLYNGENELSSLISDRQKEMEDYAVGRQNKHKSRKQSTSSSLEADINLKDVVENMQSFVKKLSSYEGAELPKNRNSSAVELDADQFMREMESALGLVSCEENHHDAELEEGSTSSSEMDFDMSEDENDSAEACGDDNTGDSFMQSYSDALNEELNETALRKSFVRASEQPSNDEKEGTSNASKDTSKELSPVDVDFNLVKSFLDSYSSQEGLPGPASNLLGLMGLKFPHGASNK